ncbi:DNA mismatch repair protein pms1 [Sphaceloma murrayae]|uniref:DNA mismatch repair protein pms1 n=1 Tax=Sphaceloma murrayae TaxID=2082308 RepID=A0A2K1QPZ8_9PEZI|nr:DNA mismatch repair protein pms1 [Sphaceloma murrayae]
MATIKAIEAGSIHQIQSGQVIVDLTSVVKELVENALDAQATSIEVRFKNNGLDSIEVQDNGSGIAPEDFETVARKHYTSKLSNYDDLDSLETFGFRGEALSSLCALSDFHVVTATAGPKGSRLDFETSGALRGTSVIAAQKGTTVAVAKLFKNLPVRRRELEKNVKREYGKVLNFLQAYACISTNVRFSVTNQPAKGKKTTVFATKSNPTTKENIVNVYGAKTLLALVAMNLELEMQPSHQPATQSKRRRLTDDEVTSRRVVVQGHISRPVFGEGRQAPDRQMFFVNSRPCALPQVSKAFNEVYRSFNVSQSPFIFANLIMDTNAYDVNVSPDKRTILLHDQITLLENLKESLTTLFEQQDQTVPASGVQAKALPAFKQPTLFRTESSRDSSAREDSVEEGPHFADTTPNRTPRLPGELITSWARRDAESRPGTQQKETKDGQISLEKMKLAEAFARRGLHNGESLDEVDAQTGTHTAEELSANAVLSASDPKLIADDLELSQFSPAPALPQEVQDFNARILSQKLKRARPTTRTTTETLELEDGQSDNDRRSHSIERSDSEDIPSTRLGTQKAAPGPVQNAFDRMRPKRLQSEVATVTVGDQTMLMTLEGPESKKRRIHTPKMHHKTKHVPSSSGFLSGLKMFAAPGTQMADDAEAEDDIEDVDASSGDAEWNGEEQKQEHGEDDGDETVEDLEGENGQSPMTDEDELVNGAKSTSDTSVHSRQSSGAGLFVEADDSDDEYLDEDDKKVREDAKVAQMIEEAESKAAQPTEETLRRASQALRSNSRRRDAPFSLQQTLSVDMSALEQAPYFADTALTRQGSSIAPQADDIAADNAETKLSLTISKPDFAEMRIVGQFNLGFVLAMRPSKGSAATSTTEQQDHLFIIDQHAADEKFNFERLYAETKLTPQRLVTPKVLQLSAVEEELITSNEASLVANGFEIDVQASDHGDDDEENYWDGNADLDGGGKRQFRLLTLPTSKETTFSTADLEELLHLLSENAGAAPPPNMPASDPSTMSTSSSLRSSGLTQPSPLLHRSSTSLRENTIIRPSRVRKMLAMRACRSSIMVGKNLTRSQMGKVVRHMGEMERPWNCPHGRPTMRHLAGLGEWGSWTDDLVAGEMDWMGYVG